MKKLILTALAAMAVSAPAMADRWYFYSLDSFEWYSVNLDSIKCRHDVCSAWGGSVNIDPKLSYDTQLARWDVDCTENKVKLRSLLMYVSGKQFDSEHLDGKWQFVAPGTLGGQMANAVCNPSSRNPRAIFSLDTSLPDKAQVIRRALYEARKESLKR